MLAPSHQDSEKQMFVVYKPPLFCYRSQLRQHSREFELHTHKYIYVHIYLNKIFGLVNCIVHVYVYAQRARARVCVCVFIPVNPFSSFNTTRVRYHRLIRSQSQHRLQESYLILYANLTSICYLLMG